MVKVKVENRKSVTMSQLQIGDKVQTGKINRVEGQFTLTKI